MLTPTLHPLLREPRLEVGDTVELTTWAREDFDGIPPPQVNPWTMRGHVYRVVAVSRATQDRMGGIHVEAEEEDFPRLLERLRSQEWREFVEGQIVTRAPPRPENVLPACKSSARWETTRARWLGSRASIISWAPYWTQIAHTTIQRSIRAPWYCFACETRLSTPQHPDRSPPLKSVYRCIQRPHRFEPKPYLLLQPSDFAWKNMWRRAYCKDNPQSIM